MCVSSVEREANRMITDRQAGLKAVYSVYFRESIGESTFTMGNCMNGSFSM